MRVVDINVKAEMKPADPVYTPSMGRRSFQDKWLPNILMVGFFAQTIIMIWWVVQLFSQSATLSKELSDIRSRVQALEQTRYTAEDALKDIRANSGMIQFNTGRIDRIEEKLNLRSKTK